jgi:hypothetical protein
MAHPRVDEKETKMERGVSLVALVFALGSATGCAAAQRVRPGLANVPILPVTESVDVHDVVANADDSCPLLPGSRDPLAYRYPACTTVEATRASYPVEIVPVSSADPSSVRWTVHRRGLPPCEGRPAPPPSDAALALCSVD